MDFSVIIPAYNSEKTIMNTLRSVALQDQSLVREIIVVDDGSTDSTSAIVERFAAENPQLKVQLIRQKNSGPSAARNLGMQKAAGEWIALLDSDDEWEAFKLRFQADLLSANPHIDFLGGEGNDKPLRILFRKVKGLKRVTIRDLCFKSFPMTPTEVLRRQVFLEYGGFDESRRYCEDMDYIMRLCTKINVYYHPAKVMRYGQGKKYGISGLSQNVREMFLGSYQNWSNARARGDISIGLYAFVSFMQRLRYWRRKAIVGYYRRTERDK